MTKTRLALVFAALGFLAVPGVASAMPVGQLGGDVNAATADSNVQKARWVCGPYGRCAWRPNYSRPYRYYGYAPRAYAPRYYAPRYYAPRYYGPRHRYY